MPTKTVNGVRVEMTQAEIEALEPTLAEKKADLKKAVNAKAQSIRWSNVPFSTTVEGVEVNTAVQFRSIEDYMNLDALRGAIRDGATEVTVTMEDNKNYTLTAAEFTALYNSGLQRNQLAHFRARALKDAIDAAETAADLPDIETGWPGN